MDIFYSVLLSKALFILKFSLVFGFVIMFACLIESVREE